MGKDLKDILTVRACSSQDNVNLNNDVVSTLGVSNEVDNQNVNEALRIASQLIETASFNVHKEARHYTARQDEVMVPNSMNIPFDDIVYKNLVELNVNEYDFITKDVSKFKKKGKMKPKDLTPSIEDYRTLQFSIPKVFEAKVEPPTKHMTRKYNGRDMYDLVNPMRIIKLD